MHIDILGTHIALTDALRDHVHAEFEKLKKHLDPGARIAVEIGKTSDRHKQGDIFRAEARIVQPKAEYFADVVANDLYTAINTLVDDLTEQIVRSKSRHRALLKSGRAIIKKLLRF